MKFIRKTLAILMTFALVFTSVSFTAFAEETTYCGKGEHTHSIENGCYELICEKEGHVHDDTCYSGGAVGSGDLICGKEEHTHSIEDGCYKLNCDKEEHAHSSKCYVEPDVSYTTGVNTLVALPDYNSVTLLWTPVAGATSYNVIRTDGCRWNNIGVGVIGYKGANYCSFRDTNNAKDTTYTYCVEANITCKQSKKTNVTANRASAARVRTAYYYVKFKKAVTLKSHDKKKKKVKFKKGQVVRAEGFGTGAYQFRYYVAGANRLYNAKKIRMKAVKGDISVNAYEGHFGDLIAENFVNHRGCSSKKSKMMWANLYTQRVKVFEGSKGNWHIVQNYICASGKASSPSPTGWSKKIGKQMRVRQGHKVKWWSTYSAWNSFHSGLPKKCIANGYGKLYSNGCIRLSTEGSQWIMKNVPKKSRVVVF